jgi:hypothetical protein
MSLLSNGYRGCFRSVKFATQFHLLLRLRMSGGIPPVLLYVLMMWTDKILPFYLIIDWVNQCLV